MSGASSGYRLDNVVLIIDYQFDNAANDVHTAQRIHGRAIKRCGELVHEFEANKGGRPSKEKPGRAPSQVSDPPTRTEAADAAGLSEWQRKTALRVANIPDAEFEAMIEQSPTPYISNSMSTVWEVLG
jgi:hypothetical protein